jgi:hypothetical protein
MAYHLPPIQPVWSFIAPANLPGASQRVAAMPESLPAPVQNWSLGPDGRPQLRWTVGRRSPPEV